MPTSKKRITRKKRDFTKVTVTLPDYFDGEFHVPDFNRLNVTEIERLNNDEITAIADLFRRTGCTEEADLVLEFELDEVQAFIEAWQKASNVSLPKSEG